MRPPRVQVPTFNTPMSATTLPACYYVDPEFFREELERFYCQDWICAGRMNQIPQPGDYFLRDIAGESIIITRDANDSLPAFFNVRRHRGTRICARPEGHCAGRIQCGSLRFRERNGSRSSSISHSVHTSQEKLTMA